MRKLTKGEKLFVASTKAWLKQQQNSIDSCDLSIKHAKELIKSCQRQIKLESEEKRCKQAQYDEVKRSLDSFINN